MMNQSKQPVPTGSILSSSPPCLRLDPPHQEQVVDNNMTSALESSNGKDLTVQDLRQHRIPMPLLYTPQPSLVFDDLEWRRSGTPAVPLSRESSPSPLSMASVLASQPHPAQTTLLMNKRSARTASSSSRRVVDVVGYGFSTQQGTARTIDIKPKSRDGQQQLTSKPSWLGRLFRGGGGGAGRSGAGDHKGTGLEEPPTPSYGKHQIRGQKINNMARAEQSRPHPSKRQGPPLPMVLTLVPSSTQTRGCAQEQSETPSSAMQERIILERPPTPASIAKSSVASGPTSSRAVRSTTRPASRAVVRDAENGSLRNSLEATSRSGSDRRVDQQPPFQPSRCPNETPDIDDPYHRLREIKLFASTAARNHESEMVAIESPPKVVGYAVPASSARSSWSSKQAKMDTLQTTAQLLQDRSDVLEPEILACYNAPTTPPQKSSNFKQQLPQTQTQQKTWSRQPTKSHFLPLQLHIGSADQDLLSDLVALCQEESSSNCHHFSQQVAPKAQRPYPTMADIFPDEDWKQARFMSQREDVRDIQYERDDPYDESSEPSLHVAYGSVVDLKQHNNSLDLTGVVAETIDSCHNDAVDVELEEEEACSVFHGGSTLGEQQEKDSDSTDLEEQVVHIIRLGITDTDESSNLMRTEMHDQDSPPALARVSRKEDNISSTYDGSLSSFDYHSQRNTYAPDASRGSRLDIGLHGSRNCSSRLAYLHRFPSLTMVDSSVRSGSGGDDPDNDHRLPNESRRDVLSTRSADARESLSNKAMTRAPPPLPASSSLAAPLVEVSPDTFLPLVGTAHATLKAMRCGIAVTATCWACQANLACVPDCSLVICPDCRIVSPVDIMSSNGNNFAGHCQREPMSVGLGYKKEG